MRGYDAVGGQQIGTSISLRPILTSFLGVPNVKFKCIDKVSTLGNWVVRIYKVREPANRGAKAYTKFSVSREHDSRFADDITALL